MDSCQKTTKYKRYAFISYSHKDIKEAKWLHKHLEYYKLPNDIFNEYDEKNRYLRPVFRDKEDIGTGVLKSVLRKELEVSKYLIVICSPNSAQSIYVSQEAQVFIDQGRIKHIIPYIIDGIPKSGGVKECFPKSLITHIENFPDDELLGANINEVGRQKAFIRIVSSLLNVEFDALWKRHKREQLKRWFCNSVLSTAVLFAFISLYNYMKPIDVTFSVLEDCEKNSCLPQLKSINIYIEVGNKKLELKLKDGRKGTVVLPKQFLNTKARVKIAEDYFMPIDTFILLKKNNILPIKRDESYFGSIKLKIIDEVSLEGVPNLKLRVDGFYSTTDRNGDLNIKIPLKQQKKLYKLNSDNYIFSDNGVIEAPFNSESRVIFAKHK